MIYLIRLLSLFLVTVTLLPILSTGKWYVRWWDFPRLQVATLLAVATVMLAGSWLRSEPASQNRHELLVWLVFLVPSFVWQVSHIIQFSPLWAKEVPVATDGQSEFVLMVSNLDKDNPDRESVPQEISEERPDVLLLLEYDQRWKDQLSEIRKQFKFHHDVVRDEGLGIALWSNFSFASVETRHTISDRRPSIWATLEFFGQRVNFVGVHPTPPGLIDSTGDDRRDSRVRDAELIITAQQIAERSDESWIVAGDFNDVAWSHTTRLFKRIGGLKDPRIGRSYMGTYMAQYPPLRCPIDHVFLSEGFSVGRLSRKKIGGSDHFAVLATIINKSTSEGTTPTPHLNDADDADQIIEEGKLDAEERDVVSEEAEQILN